ncbi:MAG: hypothetical protein AAFU03_12780 [Bacteroidota bacterium]
MKKIILKTIKWLCILVFGIVTTVFILLAFDQDYHSNGLTLDPDHPIYVQKEYQTKLDSNHYDSLLTNYGKNKILAKGFELQCLLALSHYPELKETPIEFRVQPTFLPLSSRPAPLSVLLPWIKRKYLIVISNKSTDFWEDILLKNTPFNEQVGILGHELGHTVYYQDKSALQLVNIAYRYEYDEAFHLDFERETDKRAIAHGLGYQLYDFAFFVRIATGNSKEEILTEKGDVYLSPLEIAAEMKKFDFYRDSLDHPDIYFTKLE